MTAIDLPVSPELNIGCAAVQREQWLAALAEQPVDQPLRLSLSAVDDIDSAGVQLLLALRATAREEGRSLRLEAASGAVRSALATFGLLAVIDQDGVSDAAD